MRGSLVSFLATLSIQVQIGEDHGRQMLPSCAVFLIHNSRTLDCDVRLCHLQTSEIISLKSNGQNTCAIFQSSDDLVLSL
jgi:hypothetical protein